MVTVCHTWHYVSCGRNISRFSFCYEEGSCDGGDGGKGILYSLPFQLPQTRRTAISLLKRFLKTINMLCSLTEDVANIPTMVGWLLRTRYCCRWGMSEDSSSSNKRKPKGSPRSVRPLENTKEKGTPLSHWPRRSVRWHFSAFNNSDPTVRRILHSDLHFHRYSSWSTMIRLLVTGKNIEFSQSRCWNVKSLKFWNSFYCPKTNTRQPHERRLYTVWCGWQIWGDWQILFEEITANADRYTLMLQN